MTQQERETLCLSKKLEQMKSDVDAVQQERREQISSLQEELEKITHRTQVHEQTSVRNISETIISDLRCALVFRSPPQNSACSSRN